MSLSRLLCPVGSEGLLWRGFIPVVLERCNLPQVFAISGCNPSGAVHSNSVLVEVSYFCDCSGPVPFERMVPGQVLEADLVTDGEWRARFSCFVEGLLLFCKSDPEGFFLQFPGLLPLVSNWTFFGEYGEQGADW